MKHLLRIAILFISILAQAQSDTEGVKVELLKYFDYVEANNSDGVIGYMHPKVFETISKEQMKAGMDQMLQNEQMKIEFLSTEITNISKIITLGDSQYSLIDYSNDMRMTFLSVADKSLEEKQTFMDFMTPTIEEQFGEGNVKKDVETASLIIHVESNIYAVNNVDFGGWKFLANDPNMATVVNGIIPAEVRNELTKQN
ncbi:hypothetical protein [Mangrovimonas sp. DI 80]|uniref:hypothetical protein n=1 Tax=Mangrovimonas sp. DI 80 TaxID=1779330 RepID=UPI000975C5C9|nr:hypothetical protein [Mangrovimonas sp. DI 80]OMP32141.1 hypothetical protein BKM32_03575 [Mangrovimonas sp. DI 80]